MEARAKKPATYEDIIELPENRVGEIVDDELFVSPRPGGRHAQAASVLGAELITPFGRGKAGPGGWWILVEPELHLGRDVMVPDLAGWRRERMPQIRDEPFFTLAPDWICEILSPSTARLDLSRKLPKYAHASVTHAWTIDPALKTLQVFRLENKHWSLATAFSGEEMVRAEPFDAVELDLSALWLP
jgi:Uma2 family endonuclease